MENFPRLDVGVATLAAAITGLIMALVNGQYDLAVLGPLLVVVIKGGLEYLVPRSKEIAGTIAGAVVLVGVYFASGRQIGDAATVNSAVTYLVALVLVWALPRLQAMRGEIVRE